jgi:hypothetical protein
MSLSHLGGRPDGQGLVREAPSGEHESEERTLCRWRQARWVAPSGLIQLTDTVTGLGQIVRMEIRTNRTTSDRRSEVSRAPISPTLQSRVRSQRHQKAEPQQPDNKSKRLKHNQAKAEGRRAGRHEHSRTPIILEETCLLFSI